MSLPVRRSGGRRSADGGEKGRRGHICASTLMAQFTALLLLTIALQLPLVDFCLGEHSSAFHSASTPKQSSPAPPQNTRVSRAPLRVPVIKGRIPYSMPGDAVISGNGSSNNGGLKETTPPVTAVSEAPPTAHHPHHHHQQNHLQSGHHSSSNSNYHSNHQQLSPPPLQQNHHHHHQQQQQQQQSYHHHHHQPQNNFQAPPPPQQPYQSNFPPSFFGHLHQSLGGSSSLEQTAPNSNFRKPEGSVQSPVKVPLSAPLLSSPPSSSPSSDLQTNEVTPPKNMKMGRFPLDELVNAIAQAAINGDIPFNKVDLRKPFKAQSLQIPILLLRPEDLYRATGAKINFKLITAQPIRIPIFDEPPAPFKLPSSSQPAATSIHAHHKARHHHHPHLNNNNLNNHHHHNNYQQNVNHFNSPPAAFNGGGFNGGGGHREGRQMNFNGNNNNNNQGGPNYNNNNGGGPKPDNFVLFPNGNGNNNGNSNNGGPSFNPNLAPKFQQPNYNNQGNPSSTSTASNIPTGSTTQTTASPQFNSNQQAISSTTKQPNYGKPPKSPKLDVLKVIPAPKLVKSANEGGPTSNHIEHNSHRNHNHNNNNNNNNQQQQNYQQQNLQNHNFDNGGDHQHSPAKNQRGNAHHSDSPPSSLSSYSFSGPSNSGRPSEGYSQPKNTASSSSFPQSNNQRGNVHRQTSPSFSSSSSGPSSSSSFYSNSGNSDSSSSSSSHSSSGSGSSSSSTSTSTSSENSGKRKRPVIRIKAERPPVRVNSVRAPIKVRPDRPPVRMNPMVRKTDGSSEKYADDNGGGGSGSSPSSNNIASSSNMAPTHDEPENIRKPASVIPEKYLKGMPKYRGGGDEEIKTVPFPKFSGDDSGSSLGDNYDHHQQQNHLQHSSRGDQRSSSSSSNQQTQFDDDHVNVNAAFSKASLAKNNGGGNNNLDFGSVFRSKEGGGDEPETEQSSSRTSSSGSTGRHITRTTSGNIEDLEKSGYDKQLVKTLKNLMATTAKRHKLNFEDEEESSKEETKVTRRGKIPEKYLQGSPLEGVMSRGTSTSASELDDHYKTSESNFQKQRTSQQPYQHFGGGEGGGESGGDGSGDRRFNTELGGSYRVAGFDPNYEYIDSAASTRGTSSALASSDNLLPPPSSDDQPSYHQEESIDADGKKVKKYVMTGVIRQKVDEVLRSDDGDGNGGDDQAQDNYRAEESDPIPAEVLVAKVFESNRTLPPRQSPTKTETPATSTADAETIKSE